MKTNSGHKSGKLTRRGFFHILVALLASPAILWWFMVGRRDMKMSARQQSLIIGKAIPPGVSFIDFAIVINNEDGVSAFEAKCTHLGCRISKIEGDQLVCPCHGSRYNLSGKPVKGPAVKKLKKLKIVHDPRSGEYIIHKNE
ncbi:MAG: Rieske (2Fe-2S) protein [Bacteroidales bacterium]|nr:Rieske (2Fe-2S) protein [Bacteroidales bacterium]